MPAARPNLSEGLNRHPLVQQFLSGHEDAPRRLSSRAATYEKRIHQLLSGGTRVEPEEAAHLLGILNQGSINDKFSQGIHESSRTVHYMTRGGLLVLINSFD